jgi:hypothetical protein
MLRRASPTLWSNSPWSRVCGQDRALRRFSFTIWLNNMLVTFCLPPTPMGARGRLGKSFLSSVLGVEDTLTRTALHTVEEGGRVVSRSPLKVQTYKAEQKVAKAFQDANPAISTPNLSPRHHSGPKPHGAQPRGAPRPRARQRKIWRRT